MNNKAKLSFTVITLVLGFMLAVQFYTTKEPVVRETRDIWELRGDLKKAQNRQSELLKEIRKYDELLTKYEEKSNVSQEETLKETIDELKKQAGLTELSGPGIVLTIEPKFDPSLIGQPYKTVSPELLTRLINELNRYQATGISVAGQRVISISPIRDVGGQTHINNKRLPPLPIEVKVTADSKKAASKLQNYMAVSQSVEDFAIENLKLSSALVDFVTLPAYDNPLRGKNMEPVDPEKEDS